MNKYKLAIQEIEQSLDMLQDYMSETDLTDAEMAKAKKSHKVWSEELVKYKKLAAGD